MNISLQFYSASIQTKYNVFKKSHTRNALSLPSLSKRPISFNDLFNEKDPIL